MPTSPGPLTEVSAIEGGRTLLPCDVTPPTPGDSAILVLFYNGITGLPIYSIDARSGPLGRSIHWSELGGRAHFDLVSSPSGLVIDDVDPQDHGHYRCRVDFMASPTRNLRVKLLVVEPPKRVTILAASGKEVTGVIGPYPLGGLLVLTCQVTGGSPRPWVNWWHEESLLDDLVEEAKGQVTRNILTLPNLTRQHLYRVLTCRCNNSNLTVALAATVTLDMSFPPLEVGIQEDNLPMTEGKEYTLSCEARGSRPPAVITWWIDGVLMTDTKHQVTQEGQVSVSTLHLVPRRNNNGAVVSCRADNPRLSAAALEDSRKLLVYYSPRLHLRAGQTLNMSNIKEGDDVYFECDIKANPSVFKVQWFLNSVELHHNVAEGVIQSNQSLVLQSVGRGSSGLYTCRAVNTQGSDTSNALNLNVKFSPVCAAGQKWVYGGRRHQAINVTCRVEAHPEASNFRWAFNTSSEFVELPQDRVHSSRSRSLVEYTPQTHHDFGSLLCWGRNLIDVQQRPCVFHVVPAGVPESVTNCSAWHNGTAAGEVVVSCQAGWSGGLAQTFTLEVRQAQPKNFTSPRDTSTSMKKVLSSTNTEKSDGSDSLGKLLASLQDQNQPHFTVTGLEPGTEYHLVVVASNSQGPAQPAVLAYFTPIDVAEKQTSATAAEASDFFQDFAPMLGVVVGVVASLLVCSVVVVVVCTRTAHAHNRRSNTKVLYDKAAAAGEDGGFARQHQHQQGPDVILIKNEPETEAECQQLESTHLKETKNSFLTSTPTLLQTDSSGSGRFLLTERSNTLSSDPASITGVPLAATPLAASKYPGSSLGVLPQLTDAGSLVSYFPAGHDVSPACTSSRSAAEPALQGHPDLCPRKLSVGDSSMTLAVSYTHSEHCQSSV